MKTVNDNSEQEGKDNTTNASVKWILENDAVGDNNKTVTTQIYLGQSPAFFQIYYKGGRVAGKAATHPDVFADVTINGELKSTRLVPDRTTTFNGTLIILRTAHGQSFAEGTATLLQASA